MNDLATLPREIQLLQQAAAFLAECMSLDEIKSIRNKAEAIRLYQKKIGESLTNQNAAAEIKLRAERRMGELLSDSPKHEGGRPTKTGNATLPVTKIADLGVTKMESSLAQSTAPPYRRRSSEATLNQTKATGEPLERRAK